MKIKEIEALTGMSRDNIRFYEKCGLLEPHRNDNGYRDYSEEDVKILKRIKLLRCLYLSIENIKDIQANKIDLVNQLDAHIKLLEEEKIDIEQSMNICKQMILDHVTYDNLDSSKYLQNFDHTIEDDVIPRLKAPIRRYIARGIDLSLYSSIFRCIMVFVFNARLTNNTGVDLVIKITSLITMLLLEPYLLSKFGTTFGKFLLSLKITDEDGNFLSYRDAFDRTLNVIIYGYGCLIPILNPLCMFLSYRKCEKNIELNWEENNIQTLTEEKIYKIFSIVIYYLIITVLAFLIVNYSTFPPNRGALTLSEFSQNYNFVEKEYENSGVTLDKDGNWIEKEMINDSYVIPSIKYYPKLNYVVENNELIEVSFIVNKNDSILNYATADNVRNYIILAFIKSQDSYSVFDFDAANIINKYIRQDSFKFEAYGLEIIQKTKYEDDGSSVNYKNYTVEFIIRKK